LRLTLMLMVIPFFSFIYYTVNKIISN